VNDSELIDIWNSRIFFDQDIHCFALSRDRYPI
jgi:hypothetical protein